LPNAGTAGSSPTPDDIASIAASNSSALAGEFLSFVKAHYRLRDHVRAVKP